MLIDIFFQRRHTDGQETYETMLSIIDYLGIANKSHTAISPHT